MINNIGRESPQYDNCTFQVLKDAVYGGIILLLKVEKGISKDSSWPKW